MEQTYSIRQASVLLGIKVRTVREWIRKGKLRAKKDAHSRRWSISEAEIKRLTNGNED